MSNQIFVLNTAKDEDREDTYPLGVSLKDVTQAYAQTLADAPDVIHCMVATGNNNNDIYVSTDHSIYLYDPSRDEFKEIRLAEAHNIFMISLCKEELLITTTPVDEKRKNSILRRTTSRSVKRNAVLAIDLKTLAEGKTKLSFSAFAPWLCINLKGDWCVTDTQRGFLRILKTGAKSETKKGVGKGFLQSPCCVVQNSSGRYIIADSGKKDVYIFEDDGRFVTSLKVKNIDSPVEKMESPFQLASDSKDRLYVATIKRCTVYVFSASFEYLEEVPFGPADGTTHISCLMVNPRDDTLCVALGTTIKTLAVDSIDQSYHSMNDQSRVDEHL